MSGLWASLRCAILFLSSWAVFIECAKLRTWRGPEQFMQGSFPLRNVGFGMTSNSDGKIYIFGGGGTGGVLYDALWQYDPSTQTWTDLTFSASGERAPPTGIPGLVSVNGKIYTFGGQGNINIKGESGLTNQLYEFDPATMAWKYLTPLALGKPPLERAGYGSTTTHGDIIYIFGGYSNIGFSNDLFQFDTVTMTWTELTDQISGTKPPGRGGTCFTALEGKFYLFGGMGLSETYSLISLNDLYVLDLSAKTWTELKGTGTPVPRAWLSFSTLNRKIYVFGGLDVATNVYYDELYEFDPSTMVWTNMASVMTVAEGSTAPLVRDGTGMALSGESLYVFGGIGDNAVFFNDFFRWDFSTQIMYTVDGTIKGQRPVARIAGGLTVAGSELYVFAGAGNNESFNDMFRLDPETMIWTNLTSTMSGSVPSPRDSLGFSSVGEAIYVFGGKFRSYSFNDLYRLNVSTMSWTDLTVAAKGTAATARHSHGFIASPKTLYVFGGIGSLGILNDFFELDIASMTWTNLTGRVTGDAPTNRYDLGLAWAMNNLYLFGGYGIEGLYHNDLLMYDPAKSTWQNLQQRTSGIPPAPRSQHGFTAIGNKLYVFGGFSIIFAGGVTDPVFLDDFFVLDIQTMAWTELTNSLGGSGPSSRCSFGFGTVGGSLFVFGGEDKSGLLNDVYAVSPPQQMMWPSGGSVAGFIPVFDGDTLIVDGEGTMSQELELCQGVLPCQLDIQGEDSGKLDVLGSASIACLADLGCTSVTLDSIKVDCHGSSAPKSLLRAQGSEVLINQCEISNCASQGDGGALQSFDNAVVAVQNSIFLNVSSAGFGGALSAVGSNMRVTDSMFYNCSSMSGGGAVASISYECYGSADLLQTVVSITNSTFKNCSTYGSGGAILAASDLSQSKATVSVDIETSKFSYCTAVAEGGAIRASGVTVTATVKISEYTNCKSAASGGAISVADSAATSVIQSTFSQNSAAGTGGGAIHIDGGNLVAVGAFCNDNQAPNGGGGALFWEGSIPPKIFPWCQKGSWGSYKARCASPGCMPSCTPCAAGKYLAEDGTVSLESCADCLPPTAVQVCISCDSGKYSSSSGASECLNCPVGKYTQSDGASACINNASQTRSLVAQSMFEESPSARIQNPVHFITLTGPFSERADRSRPRFSIVKPVAALFQGRMGRRSGSADFCGADNYADYGLCLASSYKALEARELPSSSAPAYAGIAFTFSVVKKDFYDQDIASDSSSLLQTLTSLNGLEQADSSVLLTGITTTALVNGKAVFSLALRPTVETLTPSQGIVTFERQPYVVFQGADRASLRTSVMQSLPYVVAMANGSSVCPQGNVLILDRSGLGGCQLCAAGTYSIDPLAGPTPQTPACLTCPSGAECPGGHEIHFLIGSWVAKNGMYRLIGCPEGHKLLNTINGAFAHDVQNCVACTSNQYIMDSNNSAFQCQNCPTGAVCDGSTLKGSLAGSVWNADMATGTYVLASCPPGYVVQATSLDSQQCSAWTAPLFVSLTVGLPMTLEEFDSSKQIAFQQGLAKLASTTSDHVMIASIKQSRRSTPSIQVASNVAAANSSAAADIAGKLNSPALTMALSDQGLPQATILGVGIVNTNQNSVAALPLSVIIGASVGGFVCILLMSVGGIYLIRRLQAQASHRAFLVAFKKAQPDGKATGEILPAQMRKHYLPEKIVGRGAFGVVIGSKSKAAGNLVAIKIVIPSKGTFDDKEERQLKREAAVLEMFTKSRCQYAVHLTGVDAVHFQPEICWFVMDWLDGDNMETVLSKGPISDLEIIKLARGVLAALKEMHAEGLVHRDIKPANIVRTSPSSGKSTGTTDDVAYTYRLVDFGTTLGVDETIAREAMMTLTANRNIGVGTPAYMSPEMFKEPETAMYPTDLWSLGVSLFELATGRLPFIAESEFLWSFAVAGNMDEKPPYVLDLMEDSARSKFDNNLAKVISQALEKRVPDRFQTADEMHEAIYCCLVYRGEAVYSAFISYRVASEEPVARILFDELNHTLTPGGHRVTIFWDAHRLVKGEDWEEGFANGLLNSLCMFSILSYGATAPLAALPEGPAGLELVQKGWEEKPCGRERLRGRETDAEDNVLKELMIASALLERRTVEGKAEDEQGLLQSVYPLLVGRQHPQGHAKYPGMGSFFNVQGGGGKYPPQPSPPTNRAVARFLQDKGFLPPEALKKAEERTVLEVVQGITALQGCELWNHAADLMDMPLSKEQIGLIGKGYAGPPVVGLDGVELTEEQRKLCRQGLDEIQLRLLKAQIRAKRNDFYDVIDRAVEMCSMSGGLTKAQLEYCRSSSISAGTGASGRMSGRVTGRGRRGSLGQSGSETYAKKDSVVKTVKLETELVVTSSLAFKDKEVGKVT